MRHVYRRHCSKVVTASGQERVLAVAPRPQKATLALAYPRRRPTSMILLSLYRQLNLTAIRFGCLNNARCLRSRENRIFVNFFFGNSFYSSLLSYICIIQIENISYIFIDTVSRINIRTRFVALYKRIRTVYCSLKTCK